MLSAGLVWFSFPNAFAKTLHPWGAPLAWIALVPLFIALNEMPPKRAAILGWVFGFFQFASILYWIAILEEAKELGPLAWAALVSYLSLFFLVFGWGYAWLSRKINGSGVWIAPFLWTALEYIRGTRPWGGFNWGEIGYSQAPYPPILYLTSFTGEYGLTFLIVWTNLSIARFLIEFMAPKKLPKPDLGIRSILRIPFLLPVAFLIVFLTLGQTAKEKKDLKKRGTVVLLQPCIDQSVKWSRSYEDETYKRFDKLIQDCASHHPDLILWPETGAPSFLRWNPKALREVTNIVLRSKTPQLVGCLDLSRGKPGTILYYNAAIHFGPDGKILGVYCKRHLVPFGEFMPFQKYFSFLGPIVQSLGTFEPGPSYMKFPARTFTYSPTICYEATFPGDVQKALENGADALVSISNDAWYGRTAAAFQHALMEVVRTVEERRPLLRAANTGISLVTDPYGNILNSTELFKQGFLLEDVWVAGNNTTLFSLYGNWFPWVCWLVTMIAFLFSTVRRKINSASEGVETQLVPQSNEKN